MTSPVHAQPNDAHDPPTMKLSASFSGALRTFAYFMASGTQNTLQGVDYVSLYGEEPSAIELVSPLSASFRLVSAGAGA